MSNRAKKLLAVRNFWRTLPVYFCVLASKQKKLVKMDVERWKTVCGVSGGLFVSLNYFLTYYKQFRNLLQHRMKLPARGKLRWVHFAIARILWKPLDSLYINTTKIGGGLYIQHGVSTVISAKQIGENCRVFQQVTIGYKGTEAPVLEDNVSIACGAIVLGGVTMHRNSIAAAGAVVLKDVEENAIVGGVPAKLIRYKGEDELDFQG